MAHIIVNGISAKAGGGKSILTNFLAVLSERGSRHQFTVLVSDASSYAAFERPGVQVISLGWYSRQALLPFTTAFFLPRLIRRLHGDLLFNLADIPVPTERKQLFLFDWPYAAYPDSIAWSRGSLIDRAKRRLKLALFRHNLRHVDFMTVQGPLLRDRIAKLYGISGMQVVPNAVSLDNIKGTALHDFKLGGGFKFLCLTYFYSHKNLEIFLDVAQLIREARLDWKIIITIDAAQGGAASAFLSEICKLKLQDIIVNVGSVPMEQVPSLYSQTDALLLPTLLETFSGTYVEAMHYGKPIFTSGYEFAQDVCKDVAWYFDPLDPLNIFETIHNALLQPDELASRVEAGRQQLKNMTDWYQAFDAYSRLFDNLLQETT